MNYYGLFMLLGWSIISYNLEIANKNNKICSISTEFLSVSSTFFIIIGSKLFQKIFRNTWTGNASFGALYGGFFYLCLISNICDPIKILNNIVYTLPILYFCIRIGNYCNGEHFKNNNYFSIIEGIFQGPLAFFILYYNNFEDPIVIFIIMISIVRILSEFFRDFFDWKNILFSLIYIYYIINYKILTTLDTTVYLLFILDIICKINMKNIRKNYGFNFSYFKEYKFNKYIHLGLFLLLIPLFNSRMIFLGALSNLLDRLINGYVSDYISLPIYPFSKYCFNIADIMITIGVLLQHVSLFL